MTRPLVLALALLVLAVAPAARADDDCTVDKQCKEGGQTCPTLGGNIDEACAKDMAAKNLVLKCQQQKATIARAVYCPQAKKGCGKSSVAPGEASGLSFLGLGLAAAALRRARSRRSPRR